MSHARPAVDGMQTDEARAEITYANDATATGRREAEYQDPGRAGDQGADYAEEPKELLDEFRPDVDQTQRTVDEPVRAPSDGNLTPGQGVNDPVAALWATDQVQQYRSRWRVLQSAFVDDPKQAITAAASLVDEAIASLTNTLNAQKQALDGWQVTRGEDTEVMRVALRRYRDFLDRLLGL